MTSWFSINLTSQTDGTKIFSGYFNTDNKTNLVLSFYDSKAPRTNLLIPTGSGVSQGPDFEGYTQWLYLGNVQYDNAYQKNWLQFDENGIIIKALEGFNGYDGYNICATTLGGEYNNNQGLIAGFTSNRFNVLTNVNVNIVALPNNPISNICFPASTPISTNQGIVAINKLNPLKHTIGNKKIVAITKTISLEDYLVCFEKNALGINYPSEKTIMSSQHKILYKGKMICAKYFIGHFENVNKIEYANEPLYNVLLEEQGTMRVNNLVAETLDPKNIIAKLYKNKQSPFIKNKLVLMMNDSILKKDVHSYKKIIKQF